jgi:hypothetical protein
VMNFASLRRKQLHALSGIELRSTVVGKIPSS